MDLQRLRGLVDGGSLLTAGEGKELIAEVERLREIAQAAFEEGLCPECGRLVRDGKDHAEACTYTETKPAKTSKAKEHEHAFKTNVKPGHADWARCYKCGMGWEEIFKVKA